VAPRTLVTIVTPTLNQAPFLEAALRSVRNQTYPNIEHIVIDGGSTDGTLDILRRAAEHAPTPHDPDSRAMHWTSEPDRGMYDAVNKGLDLARGDVLAYLASDDAYLPWAIETVMRVFERRPRVELVYGDGIKIEEETGAQRLRLFPPFDRVSLANYESLMQPAVFWRRGLYERLGGFDSAMRYVADLDYWLRAAAAGAGIAHVDEVLAVERIHAGRLSSAQKDAMAAEDQAMRARNAGDQGGPDARTRAAARELGWQRRLWMRFMFWYGLRPVGRPWRRFMRSGRLTIRSRRIVASIERPDYKLLWGAVSSALAAEALGIAGPKPPRRRKIRVAAERVRSVWRAGNVFFRSPAERGTSR
jgi:glycosyltransferase involved in cell wall biosynthesis